MDLKTLEQCLPQYFRLARRLGGGLLAQVPTRLPAGGTEMTALRDYTPGDDLRHMDWGICARHDELRIREYAGTAVCHATLLLDVSANLTLSASAQNTWRTVATVLAYGLLAQGVSLEVGTFSQRLTLEPPLCGRPRMGALLRLLHQDVSRPESVCFSQVVDGFLARRRSTGNVYLVSDFFADSDSFVQDFGPGLKRLMGAGYRPCLLHLLFAENRAEGATGDVEILDAKGYHRIITLTERDLQAYQRRYEKYLASVSAYCESHAIPYSQIASDASTHAQCLAALGLPIPKHPQNPWAEFL